jgi:hypothetical protein
MLKKLIVAIAISASAAMPAGATPRQLEVINYDEMMVLVPNLEFVGYSRISTVDACVEETGVEDWTNMVTDAELEGFEVCLISYE